MQRMEPTDTIFRRQHFIRGCLASYHSLYFAYTQGCIAADARCNSCVSQNRHGSAYGNLAITKSQNNRTLQDYVLRKSLS